MQQLPRERREVGKQERTFHLSARHLLQQRRLGSLQVLLHILQLAASCRQPGS
jgi:hypothetical protein